MTGTAPATQTVESTVSARASKAPKTHWSRRAIGLILSLALLIGLLMLSLAIGSKQIPLEVVIDSLLDNTGQDDAYIVWDLRVPRTAAAVLIGIALGVSGALIQALTRNPLADPGILGVNAGAAFFVTLGIGVFGITSPVGYVWFAFLGALAVTVAVYLIGSAGRGSADPVQLTLAGVALGAVLAGIVTGIQLLDPDTFDKMRSWNAGSIAGISWDLFVPIIPFLLLGLAFAVFAAPALNSVALGDDLARSLGTNVNRVRLTVIVAVTLLAGGATAIAGPIGFVGLMIPHVARWIVGPDQRWILAYTVLLAPCLVVASDVLGRVILPGDGELPVGIVTAFVGGPVLIILIRRRNASGL